MPSDQKSQRVDRFSQLEQKIAELRWSRLILMNMLMDLEEAFSRERQAYVTEIERLKSMNARYAGLLQKK